MFIRVAVDWLKRIVVNTAAKELQDEARSIVGEDVHPLIVDVESTPVTANGSEGQLLAPLKKRPKSKKK